jgi:hypothetical protein
MRRTAAVSAVSPTAWGLRAASQAAWLSFALMVHDLVVALSATFLLTNALLVLLLEIRRSPALNVDPDEVTAAESVAA